MNLTHSTASKPQSTASPDASPDATARTLAPHAVMERVPRSAIGVWFLLLAIAMPSSDAFGIDVVQASIPIESAWTGEAVPLIITLYSPGPFSGTAAFNLPEIQLTTIVQHSRPLVGSETVEGKSYITQRHEFMVYTQQSGEVVIPSFRVRFAGAKSFTSQAEPMEGMTGELRFRSKRPPGTEQMRMVVSATKMQAQQSWYPPSASELTAGDVIVRRVSRKVEGTTAMMLPPLSAEAPDGVQVYLGNAEVEDRSERGDSESLRRDVLKYQFPQAGLFSVPDIELSWWDPDQEQLKTQTLKGRDFHVVKDASARASEATEEGSHRSNDWQRVAIGVTAAGLFAGLVYLLTHRVVFWIRLRLQRPDRVAARQLKRACHDNDAAAAYRSMLEWLRETVKQEGDRHHESILEIAENQTLRQQWQSLSTSVFGRSSSSTPWDGASFWQAFAQAQTRWRHDQVSSESSELPSLNPSSHTA